MSEPNEDFCLGIEHECPKSDRYGLTLAGPAVLGVAALYFTSAVAGSGRVHECRVAKGENDSD
jgi:hypothetical protein